MLERITPLLLTFNERPNIERTLSKLGWASDIVVVDSGSTDGTLEVLTRHRTVRVFQRAFDNHSSQWNFALQQTEVRTEWVLALDADYVLTDAIIAEVSHLVPDRDVDGYRARFRYRSLGVALWGSLYPSVTVLYRRTNARYVQDGHTQRVLLLGAVAKLHSRIDHDDRKPFSSWLASQRGYCRLEAAKLRETSWRALGWPDRVRRLVVVAPVAVALYVLLVRGALLQGPAGWYYAFQRTVAEILLAKRLAGTTTDSRYDDVANS